MAREKLDQFLETITVNFVKQIGFGIHGNVFMVRADSSQHFSVVKMFDDPTFFERELAVYYRLRDLEISKVGEFHVPQLIDQDRKFLAIRMSLVKRPFCLDFASAYLDELPPYFPPFDENWHREKENQFGREHWPEVLAVVRELESLGIFQTDVSPSNIAL